ncbi:hypothetical protein Psfp_03019 [Pelotomaculum sp. FP]|uniref:C39 family peptidase n=1 Tax=Pelotomaculum sp. FP TaxID=261474 RepID=UPI001065FC42|nr:C39 family peptidase [Pelotomaculum sp. FP]TEB14268.1 hypothetical protein Psfp_03019 [Pelotomaculum sp. FP]
MLRIMKVLLLAVCLFASTIFPSLSLASNSSNDTVSVTEAKKMAVFQIVMDMKTDDQSPWHNKTVKIQDPIEVYDATETLCSYLFNLTIDGEPAGFIETSALRDEWPILSFSYGESDITSSQLAKYVNKNKDSVSENVYKDPLSEKVVLLGPGKFGLKQNFSDGSAKIYSTLETINITKDQNKPKQKHSLKVNQDARNLRENIDLVVGDIGSSNDGVTDDLSFETGERDMEIISSVPDLNQINSSLWTGPSGCSPTSAANVMIYWARFGYPELTEDLSNEELLFQLREEMGTYYNSEKGTSPTPVNNISPGMQDFARNRGLSEASARYLDETWLDYRWAINDGFPIVISFEDQTYYGDHSVTGMGYKTFSYNGQTTGHRYMQVHDNSPITPGTVYIAWDRNYEGIFFDQFSPDGNY